MSNQLQVAENAISLLQKWDITEKFALKMLNGKFTKAEQRELKRIEGMVNSISDENLQSQVIFNEIENLLNN